MKPYPGHGAFQSYPAGIPSIRLIKMMQVVNLPGEGQRCRYCRSSLSGTPRHWRYGKPWHGTAARVEQRCEQNRTCKLIGKGDP